MCFLLSISILSVFVFLPWCEVWGAAPGRGGLTVSLGQRALRWSWAHSSGSVTILHPGWVKVWLGRSGSCWAAKQGLIHIGCPGLDPVAGGTAVLKVEGFHSAAGPVPPGSSRCPVGVVCLTDSASRAPLCKALCKRGAFQSSPTSLIRNAFSPSPAQAPNSRVATHRPAYRAESAGVTGSPCLVLFLLEPPARKLCLRHI